MNKVPSSYFSGTTFTSSQQIQVLRISLCISSLWSGFSLQWKPLLLRWLAIIIQLASASGVKSPCSLKQGMQGTGVGLLSTYTIVLALSIFL